MSVKRVGDMSRRRHTAYRKGWGTAMATVLARIELLEKDGEIDAVALRELRAACHRPPPDLNEEPTEVVSRRRMP